MAHTCCLVVKVSYVSGHHKNTFKKQALVAGTNKAGWLSSQTGLKGLKGCWAEKAVRPACFVLCPLLAPLFFDFLKWMSYKLI